MSWISFIVAYAAITACLAITLVFRRHASGRKLLFLFLLVTGIAFFADQAAESRQLWHFPSLRLPKVLDVPAENILFALSSTVLALSCHLAAGAVLRGRRDRSKTTAPR